MHDDGAFSAVSGVHWMGGFSSHALPWGRVKTRGINDVDGSKGFVAVRSP